MSPQQFEKLKLLIRNSTILSHTEKAEWLGLLDVMNDRQAAELQDILWGNNKAPEPVAQNISAQKVEGPSRPVLPPVQPEKKLAAFVIPKAAPPAPSVPQQMPKLSHILNLPQHLQNSQGAVSHPVAPVAAEPKTVDKNTNPFALKLKAIFAEKELPAGHTQQVVEPPQAPKAPVAPIKERPKVLAPPPKPVTQPIIRPPVAPTPKSQISSEPNGVQRTANGALTQNIFILTPSESEQLSSKLNKTVGQPAPGPLVTPAITKPAVKLGPVVPIAKIDEVLKTAEAIAKGQRNTENLSTVTSLPISKPAVSYVIQSKKADQEIPAISDLALEDPNYKIPEFNNLDDLILVDSKVLAGRNRDVMLNKIKVLIGQYGYHDVVFNLEKSPLYKSYISTGAEILSGQGDFEQLGGQNHLTRPQFESMADLLQLIQAM